MFDTELVTIKNPDEIVISMNNYEFNIFNNQVRKKWGTSRLFYLYDHHKTFNIFGRRNQLTINNFFLPDILYIFQNLPNSWLNRSIIKELLTKTWLSNLDKEFTNRIDKSRLKDINDHFKLKNYQDAFIDLYDKVTQKYNLNGYLLSFDPGLGKTLTSLALMHLLKKDKVIIVAPNSTIREVWLNEINKVFKDKKVVYVVNDKPIEADYYIFNYESLNKFAYIKDFIGYDDEVGIIVDESHNFTNNDAKRVIEVKKIKDYTRSKDVLLLSGTPIRALGSDLIPALSLLDNYFTEEIGTIFKKVFGTNKAQALDVINNRLGIIMHRKLKSEVDLGLPDKYEEIIKVKIPNGKDYTLSKVKSIILEFSEERTKFYEKNKKDNENLYAMIMDIFIQGNRYDPRELKSYTDGVNYFRKHKYTAQVEFHRTLAKELNIFENNVIIPSLPQQYKEQFRNVKTIIKYVHLKIMGEVIGGLLSKLRVNMINDMLKHSKIEEIIEDSRKKTILFTTYVDVLKTCYDYLKNDKKLHPVTVSGENTKDILNTLNSFKHKSNINPLIATAQTLATGVTLVEANTVIFLNPLWRRIDEEQAFSRAWRIGQDTEVYIFKLLLDTGEEPNLSSRMVEINEWSRVLFEGIVNNNSVTSEVVVEHYLDNDLMLDEITFTLDDSIYNVLDKQAVKKNDIFFFHKYFQ